MYDAIKMVKINVGDKNYKNVYEEDDERYKMIRQRDSIVNLKVANNHIEIKEFFSQHFTSHFTSEFTYKQCNLKSTLKSGLKNHLLLHKNKRQFKCSHESCDKTFNTKSGLNCQYY